jgi:hypothetical protein
MLVGVGHNESNLSKSGSGTRTGNNAEVDGAGERDMRAVPTHLGETTREHIPRAITIGLKVLSRTMIPWQSSWSCVS